jgi:hypothetical protein
MRDIDDGIGRSVTLQLYLQASQVDDASIGKWVPRGSTVATLTTP